MLAKQIDSRERAFRSIPIFYSTQTANQFDCDTFVTNDKHTTNVKQYDEIKNPRMTSLLTSYFKGGDEIEAKGRIQKVPWEDNKG